MKGALIMALKPKAKGVAPDEEAAPDAEGGGEDYKQIAKDAAKDGDMEGMIDALCAYIDGGH